LLIILFGIIAVLIDYIFHLPLLAGFIGFLIASSRTMKGVLLKVFFFSVSYFSIFSNLSILWSVFYLLIGYFFKIILNQINGLKFRILLIIVMVSGLYIPFISNKNLISVFLPAILWIFIIAVFSERTQKISGEK